VLGSIGGQCAQATCGVRVLSYRLRVVQGYRPHGVGAELDAVVAAQPLGGQDKRVLRPKIHDRFLQPPGVATGPQIQSLAQRPQRPAALLENLLGDLQRAQ